MNLHTDKRVFSDIVDAASDDTGIAKDIIEKDYYVTMVLKTVFDMDKDLVFKGGTSLSKAYHIINRFSEDIDLNYINHSLLSRKKRKEIKYSFKDSIDNIGLSIINFQDTRSNRDFNRYEIEYSKSYETSTVLKSNVIVEMAFQEESYPCEKKTVNSIIGEYLGKVSALSVIDEYEIHPFEVTVQTYERTFVDKIFAICDYYLSGNINEHSRHLYDIYMIRPLISFDEQFFDLYVKVKEERSKIKVCYSAVSEKSISTLLNEIIESDAYKSDYNNRTTTLLMDAVGYKETIDNLKAISDLLIIKE